MTTPRQPALDAEVLLSHSAWLAALARALVAREDEVDDVVQQTYVRALEQPPRHADNVKGWLGTVARNVVGMRRRSDSARVAREAAVPLPTPVETPHEAVERAELRRMVVESVLALDEPCKSAVILRFFEERDVADIARLTATGEETVRSRLRRGVERVRKELERKVDAGTGDAAREGVAARALLFVRLREIAASGGGGGATGSAAASRTLARAGRSQATALPARVVGFGAAAAVVLVAVGGWAWWRAAHEEPEKEAARGAGAVEEVAAAPADRSEPVVASTEPPPAIVPERSSEPDATSAIPRPPEPPPAALDGGTIRGLVKGYDGAPVADAQVWAIVSASHRLPMEFNRFVPLAREQATSDPSKPPPFTWIARRSDAEGRFEFAGLAIVAGWVIGAYHPAIGTGLSDLIELDRAHREREVDMRLLRAMRVHGVVTDEAGAPVGGATFSLITRDGRGGVWSNYAISNPVGPRVGEFEYEYQCSDVFTFAFIATTFERSKHLRLDLKPGATSVELRTLKLKRQPGVVVRGDIVDPAGHPIDLAALLAERFSCTQPVDRWERASVWAIAAGARTPPVLLSKMKAPGLIEGRIDFEKSAYEVVVPDGFAGTLELRIYRSLLSSAALEGLEAPPDLACDVGQVPVFDLPTTFAARFVDATTKAPIDLRGQADRLIVLDSEAIAEAILPASDLAHGLVVQPCPAGPLTFVTNFPGYATSRFSVEVAREPARSPTTFEVAPTAARLHGFARRSDGKPNAKAEVMLLRASQTGWVDANVEPTLTNADGEFEFAAVAAGEHAVIVAGLPDEAPGVARVVVSGPIAEVEVRTTPGRLVHLQLVWMANELPKPPATTITLLDRDGLPIVRLNNYLADRHSTPLDSLMLPLVDGPCSVHVTSWGFRDAHVDFAVPRDSVEIALEPGDVH